MDFKEFIKFKGLKFVFSLILAVSGIASGLLAQEFGLICFGTSCPQPISYHIFNIISYIFFLPALALENLGNAVSVIGVILAVPYIYLLACLINLLVEKIKTKPTKTQP